MGAESTEAKDHSQWPLSLSKNVQRGRTWNAAAGRPAAPTPYALFGAQKPHTRLNKVASSTCSWCSRCSWPNTSVRSRGGLATRESVDQETRKWHRASAPPSSLARSLKKFKALETLWQLSSRAANGSPPGFIKLTTFVRQRPGQKRTGPGPSLLIFLGRALKTNWRPDCKCICIIGNELCRINGFLEEHWHIRRLQAISSANKWNETALNVNTFDSSEIRGARRAELFKFLKRFSRYVTHQNRHQELRGGSQSPSLPVSWPEHRSLSFSRPLAFYNKLDLGKIAHLSFHLD